MNEIVKLFPGGSIAIQSAIEVHHVNCTPRNWAGEKWEKRTLLIESLTSDVMVNVEEPEVPGPYNNHVTLSYGNPPTIIELDLSHGHLVYVPDEVVQAVGAIESESEI